MDEYYFRGGQQFDSGGGGDISLTMNQQRAAFLGLLIGGGMLVPGNIPNIVAASRLGISSREWAAHGLSTGILLLILCFGVLGLMATF